MNQFHRSSTEVTRPPERDALAKTAAIDAGRGRAMRERPISIERRVAPAAIERALSIYQQMKEHDSSVISQARKILTRRIYALVDLGEDDEQRLTVEGLIHLKSIERDHEIRSASDSQSMKQT